VSPQLRKLFDQGVEEIKLLLRADGRQVMVLVKGTWKPLSQWKAERKEVVASLEIKERSKLLYKRLRGRLTPEEVKLPAEWSEENPPTLLEVEAVISSLNTDQQRLIRMKEREYRSLRMPGQEAGT
jgi:hypothetical protein